MANVIDADDDVDNDIDDYVTGDDMYKYEHLRDVSVMDVGR